MSETIATDPVAAANDIGQLLRRDGDVAEQERRITKPPRIASSNGRRARREMPRERSTV
jgi:hypothetical protein